MLAAEDGWSCLQFLCLLESVCVCALMFCLYVCVSVCMCELPEISKKVLKKSVSKPQAHVLAMSQTRCNILFSKKYTHTIIFSPHVVVCACAKCVVRKCTGRNSQIYKKKTLLFSEIIKIFAKICEKKTQLIVVPEPYCFTLQGWTSSHHIRRR